MATGDPGSTGAVFSAEMVIRPDTATVTIPARRTVDLPAVEYVQKLEIAMNVLLVWHNASIYAVTCTVLTSAVVILDINHRHKTGRDAIVSAFSITENANAAHRKMNTFDSANCRQLTAKKGKADCTVGLQDFYSFQYFVRHGLLLERKG